VGKRILFGGGRHYDFAGETTTEFTTTEKIRGILEAYLRDVIIPWRQVAVERWWAGIMGFCEPPLPKITWETDRVVSVFACNGMGVALSSVIADQAAEALLNGGDKNPRRLENLQSSPRFSHSKTTHRKLPTAPTSTK
jgi:gamma-glutamylputrescine oxidase